MNPIEPLHVLVSVVAVVGILVGVRQWEKRSPKTLYWFGTLLGVAACIWGLYSLLIAPQYWPLHVLGILGGLVNALFWGGYLRAMRRESR